MKDNTQRVIARVPVDVGTYLLNEKRELLVELENRHKIAVMLIPSPALDTPNYDIQRIRSDDTLEDKPSASYHIAREPVEPEDMPQKITAAPAPEQPAVKGIKPTGPAPQPVARKQAAAPGKPGLLKRLITSLFGKKEEPVKARDSRQKTQQRRQPQTRGRGAQGSRSGGQSRQPQGNRRPGRQRQDSSTRKGRPSGARKQTRQDNLQGKTKQAETTAQTTTSSDAQKEQRQDGSPQGRSGRRGRRGGRRRSGQNRNPGNQREASANQAESGNSGTTGSTQNAPGNSQQNEGNRDSRSATPDNRPVSRDPSGQRPELNKAADTPPANSTSGQPRPAPQTAP
ncbi:MAG: hypothetical protein KAJ06_02520, partial [Gammaproteobacteria bacterium]|nr:hypothetical protein [Gammaproteobacteria bacterium]